MTPPLVQEPFKHLPRISEEQFVFIVCQHGTEVSLKTRLLAPTGPFRLAFSRPGLLTLKLIAQENPQNPPQLPEHWLIRQCGHGLGQVRGDRAETLVSEALAMAGTNWDAVHVYHRDSQLPGLKGFEPGGTALTDEIGRLFANHWHSSPVSADGENNTESLGAKLPLINQPCESGHQVLDIVLIETNQWLVGHHTARSRHSCWPGGVYPVGPPSEMVSRAYLKIAEGVAWSGLPLSAGDEIVELGSAPGGACQRLLDLGLKVTGVDPAEMDPLLLAHERFEHWRNKTSAVRRKQFSKFRWLACDANVAPTYTLEMVEDIVQYPTSRFEGLMLTLKLSSYDLVDQMPAFVERIKSWGFSRVEVRQLAVNRRECFVVAQRPVGWKRPGRSLAMLQSARANAEKRRMRTAKKRQAEE